MSATQRCSELRAIGARHGVEIENTVPKVMRSKPFGPVRGMLGRDGERWVPIHAVFPLSKAQEVVAANDAFFAEKRAFMEHHGIVYSVMSMTVGAEFFLEPAFYWFDEITPLHAASLGEDVVRPWRDRPANLDVAQRGGGAAPRHAGALLPPRRCQLAGRA